jgi:hypothetical protein
VLAQLTVLDVAYATLATVIATYFVAALIVRGRENKRRRPRP